MRLIGFTTYQSFMKKYKLKLSYKLGEIRFNKNTQQMQKEIYDYEKKHIKDIHNGLYFNVAPENK